MADDSVAARLMRDMAEERRGREQREAEARIKLDRDLAALNRKYEKGKH